VPIWTFSKQLLAKSGKGCILGAKMLSMQKKVLITDAVDPLLISGLEAAGYACDYRPKASLAEVRQILAPYAGLVINSKIIADAAFLAAGPQLEFIARLGSGLEIIDLEEAEKRGILVHRAPDGNCDAVAEHILGMLLMLAHRLRLGDQQVRSMAWDREAARGWELKGKKLGILGFGYTGRALWRRLAGFELECMVYDKYQRDYPGETELEELLAEVDILSLHLPATAETLGWMDVAFWQRLAKLRAGRPLVLLNSSRGKIIPIGALVGALESGIISAAALDVFEQEKTALYTAEERVLYGRLVEMPQVVLSPHVAGWTKESKERLAKLLLGRILSKAARI